MSKGGRYVHGPRHCHAIATVARGARPDSYCATQRGDVGEWCINLFDVAARKRQDIPPDRLWRVCCSAVSMVRPDLERTARLDDVASMAMERLFPMLKREATK